MIMVYLLFVMSIFFIRLLAGYDSRFQKGKYVSVKNTVFSKIVLDNMSVYSKTRRLKKDRNKMAVCGVCLYSALIAVLFINIVFLIIPDIPCEDWGIDTGHFMVFTNTFNDKISAISILLLFLSTIVCTAFAIVSSAKEITPKWVKVFVWVIAVCMILVAAFSMVYLLIELIFTVS